MNLQNYIYLDHNATAPLRPQVMSAMTAAMSLPLNASSLHGLGQYAKKIAAKARQNLADFIQCSADELIFTSGGTESNNMILNQDWDHVFVLATEHDSILKAVSVAQMIPVDDQGIIQLDWLEEALQVLPEKSKTLVCVQYANNETGVLQPIEKVVALAHTYNALVHTDAVQCFGKIPLSFKDLGIDFMSISAHKVGGPQGVGALIARASLTLESFLKGGGQEKNRRAGTENIAAIAGFGALPELIDLKHSESLALWHHTLEKSLQEFAPNSTVVGSAVKRLPNTTCLVMPNVKNAIQLIHFDLKGIAVNTGSACSSGTLKPSRVLKAMNLPESVYNNAIRVSSGWNTKQEDLLKFCEDWKMLFQLHHQQKESA
ncbi:MAG: cysteine desulfurase family protein [Alphaproteobacteria bacterium]